MSAPSDPFDDDQRRALDIARRLAQAGVPVFIARPITTSTGGVDWGAGCAGYRLPPRWQDTPADPATVDAWRPGDAIAPVMGHRLDAVDIDPRSRGDESAGELTGAGFWPTVIGKATTPSAGWHDFINPLGVGSRDKFRAGIDHKGGRPDGTGRGFVFIAPTVKPSKVTGELVAYRWELEPMLDELDAGDDSGAGAG